METFQQELIDFENWLKKKHKNRFAEFKELMDMYLESINSNSDCERRAIGSNEQAEEVCECSIKAVDKGNLVLINICDKHKDYTTG